MHKSLLKLHQKCRRPESHTGQGGKDRLNSYKRLACAAVICRPREQLHKNACKKASVLGKGLPKNLCP